MAATEPWIETSLPSHRVVLWFKGEDGYMYGYLFRSYNSTVTGTKIRATVGGSSYSILLTESSTATGGLIAIKANDKIYTVAPSFDYMITTEPLCKLATTSDELIGSKTVDWLGAAYSIGFVIFGKDGTMYSNNAYYTISSESFDIDITDSIDNSTLSLGITVTGLTSGTGGSLTLSVPVDKIDPNNPYLYLFYINE